MQNRSRVKKIEKSLDLKKECTYVIDPFGAKVVVSGGGIHKRISIEEFRQIESESMETIKCFEVENGK